MPLPARHEPRPVHPQELLPDDPGGGFGTSRGRRVAHARPDHVKTWFTRSLQSAGEPPVAPDGLTRLGADAPAERLAVRMLPRISSPAPHKGLRLVRAEVRGKLTVTEPKTFVGALTNGLGHGRA
ncbi:type I-E CRISPR-associated protein Cas6/Cse3/CasE [Streptomyces cyaneofuscatus]|uniref:type I-E CRISPR-associated protein Cas6/Cse3/CasE n=1 Tax=Streptomyces cyaneofuscatus TaxID=66883 RepID=UPI0037A79344